MVEFKGWNLDGGIKVVESRQLNLNGRIYTMESSGGI